MAAVHVGGYGADPPNGPNPANVQAVATGCESLGPEAAAVAPAVTAATVADGCPGQVPAWSRVDYHTRLRPCAEPLLQSWPITRCSRAARPNAEPTPRRVRRSTGMHHIT